MLPRFPLVLYPFVKFGTYANSLLWIDCAFIVAIGSRMSKKELTRELVKLNLMALIVWVLMEIYGLINYSGIIMFGADPNLGTLKTIYQGISAYLL